MRTVTLRLLVYYNTCVSRVVSRGRSCFASWSSSSSSFAEDLLGLVLTRSRRVCRKKRGEEVLYGQMAPDTHFSWSHHEGKMSLKVYNKFPDSLDAPKQFRKIRCQNRQPNFFHKTAPSSISRYYITLAPVASSGAIFIQLEANFPRPVSAFFQRT